MGSSCSSGLDKGRTFSDPGQSKGPRGRQKRIHSLTSSSDVNLHVEESSKAANQSKPVKSEKEASANAESRPAKQFSSETIENKSFKIPTPVGSHRTSQTSIGHRGISLDDYPKSVQHLLLGNVNEFKDERPREIRLFVAACESDSCVERLAIMRDVFQPLSDMCYSNGFSLEILDPHWTGSNQSAPNQSYLTQQLLRESENVPTVMLVLLNDKLGSCLPWIIPDDVFTDTLSLISDETEKKLLESSYRSDDTVQPLTYNLTVVNSNESKKVKNAQKKMAQIEEVLRKYMSEEHKEKYLKSGLETEINLGLVSKRVQPDNVFVVMRSFKDVSSVSEVHMDVVNGERDQHSLETIQHLKEIINNNVPNSNIVKFELQWTPYDFDPAKVHEHDQYIENLRETIQKELRKKLQSIMDNYSPTILPFNIPDKMYQEVKAHTTLCHNLQHIYTPTLPVLSRLSAYLTNSDETPMVLVCDTEVDTHAFTSHVVSLITDKNTATVVRFLGLTPESKSIGAMVAGMCRQIGHLYSQPVSCLDLPNFHELMQHASEQRPLIIVLGEVTESVTDWVPEQLPPHVKAVVLTSNHQVVQEMKRQMPRDCFVQVPSLPPEASSEMVKKMTKLSSNEDSTIPSVIHDQSHKAVASLGVQLFCDLSSLSVISSDQPTGNELSFNQLFLKLESMFSHIIVSKLVCFLLLTQSGLSSFHIAAILSQDEEILKALKLTDPTKVFHTLFLIWLEVKTLLQPFLHIFTFNGVLLHVLFSTPLRTLLIRRYLADKGGKDVHQILCAFCENVVCDNQEQATKRLFFLKNFEMLKYMEYPFQYAQCRREHFNNKFIFNMNWLRTKIAATSTLCVLGDMDEQQKINPEVKLLYQAIALSAGALDICHSQISSQFLSRLSEILDHSQHTNIGKLLHGIQAETDVRLEAMSTCLRHPNSQIPAPFSDDELCGLYWVPGHTNFIISLSCNSGEITVWDRKTHKFVRKLVGVHRPQDLKMVDSFQAVVLCNRELLIYDLDQGCLETKFRGVLNLKQPMFGVRNNESVITLSRNRMYINVLDIESGDTVATFKAGEDRFLNSLLISKNGKILVCGDETQKPSPLLVWELQERRLLHDLRMAQHQFITSIMDITDDGHYVVCVCEELESTAPNFLVVYDLVTGQVFKIWKWEHSCTCLAVVSATKSVVSMLDTGDVLVWDLESGSVRFQMKGVNAVCNNIILASQCHMCVTWYKGESILPNARTICVWDLEKGCMEAVV
ncbi:uncharacterized protein LOC124285681 [Haliotis rubra]|uniref:uncharacterized protein LOC124285681 n=1 Tax=Haliotis rubra TaxID=36100 RepID=UPI001EE5A41D|nr:uncharacterized protein LOC124285681 [Haliotis rubra]